MAKDPLYFIQPHIIERLLSGQFVARRQQSKAYKMRDRRNVLSPLNVTRRAVRYEPLVFSNRRDEILQAAAILNDPEKRLFLVSAPAERGKTSFVRGLCEMMGGGKEQLLWFDVSRHTDFDEVVRFLVDYMTYVCRSEITLPSGLDDQDPIATLDTLLRQAKDFPILIVIDNMEHLVAPDQTIHSRELKEAFNFLLAFENVKLVLAGRHLPLRDMNPSASAVHHLALEPLSLEKSILLLEELRPDLTTAPWLSLVPRLEGEPYLLFLFAHLYSRLPSSEAWEERLQQPGQTPWQILLELFQDAFSEKDRQMLVCLALIRHSIPFSGLQSVVQYAFPKSNSPFPSSLDNTELRYLLKKVYPPQRVLNSLRDRQEQRVDKASIDAYYQISERFREDILKPLPPMELEPLHDALSRFYNAERNKHVLERLYQARTRHLAGEATYHLSQSKKLKVRQQQVRTSSTTPMERPLELIDSSLATPRDEAATFQSFSSLGGLRGESHRSVFPIPWPGLNPEVIAREEDADFVSSKISSEYDHEMPYAPQSSPTTVKLSDDDLEKLAALISQTGPISTALPSSTGYSLELEPRLHPPVEGPGQPLEDPPQDDLPLIPPSGSGSPEERTILTALQQAIATHQRDQIIQELIRLGDVRRESGFQQNAEACYQKALEFASETHDIPHQFKIHALLGHLYQAHYQHNKALHHLRAAEHLYDRISPETVQTRLLAQAYHDMAEIFFYRHDLDAARQTYQKSLALNSDDPTFANDTLFRLALAYDESGNVPQAIAYYLKSLEAFQRQHQDNACASVLYNLSSLYYEQAQYAQAIDTLMQCLRYDEQSGTPNDVFKSTLLLSRVYEAQNNPRAAFEYGLKAYKTAQQAGHPTSMATACLHLADLNEAKQHWDEATRYLQEALQAGETVLSTESLHRIQHKLQRIKETRR